MAVTALITFVQAALTPPAGEALIGDLGVLVTASNDDNANVQAWEWEWLATPTGSAIVKGIIASGSVPSISFTPDVRGTYVLVERVYDAIGNVAECTRCFAVREVSGKLIPNFGADANAFNFGGQLLGWHPYVEEFLKQIDTRYVTDSVDVDGNVDPTATAAVISDSTEEDGIYQATVTTMATKLVASVLSPAHGGMMRAVASWKRVAGAATKLRSHAAAGELGGAMYLLNLAADEADMDLDVVVVGTDVIAQVTASVDGEYRYETTVEIRGPVQ